MPRPTTRNEPADVRSMPGPRHHLTATPPSPSKSQLPDAMKALPSDVKVIFCTCFPIAARAIRGSEFSNLRKSRCRTSTNLRVSGMHDLTASGCEHTIFPATVSSSRSNSPSLAMRNLDGCPSAIVRRLSSSAYWPFSTPLAMFAAACCSGSSPLTRLHRQRDAIQCAHALTIAVVVLGHIFEGENGHGID